MGWGGWITIHCMNIPITPEVGLLLVGLIFVGMLYTNREGILTRSTVVGKMLYAGVILVEIGLIVGERFFVPPILAVGLGSGYFAHLVDIGVFVAFMLAVFAVGKRVKERIA